MTLDPPRDERTKGTICPVFVPRYSRRDGDERDESPLGLVPFVPVPWIPGDSP
jgi:hypothetical protein